VNHELKKKDKEFSISTSVELLATRGFGFNHRKGKGDIGKTDNHQLGKIYCASAKKKDIEKLIDQDSRIRA